LSRLGTAMAAVNASAERLSAVHKPYAGARFRAAFPKQGSLRFLTGSVVFCPEEVPSRPIADYGSLVLVEQWQRDQGEALTLLSKLLSGQAEIAGQKVGSGFQQSDLEHRPYTFTSRMWSGWEMGSHLRLLRPLRPRAAAAAHQRLDSRFWSQAISRREPSNK
jgi:hypothetical protein